ncbi:MAG: D-alanyl-D-alanine carboxypeptidase, partial [Clostridiales bacterium]|nr:D-alanyl-D-alanine carboxypeptidase [Clostridiales bacterium]
LPIKDALKIFIDLMNSRAAELGAVNSHFVTPDGYHDKEHYTTAHDMGLIAREAMTHETFREIVSTPMFIIEDWSSLHDPESGKTLKRYWKNTNALIQPKDRYYYPDTIGIKTGYTSDAGSCLVAAASRDGVELLTVIMGSTKELKWLNSTALFNFGFENYTAYAPYPRGKQIEILDVTNNPEQDWVRVMTASAPEPVVHKNDINRIEQELKWDELIVQGSGDGEGGIVVSAPIARHQKLGTLSFKLDGEILDTVDLIASTAINVKEAKEPITPITLNDGIEPLQVRLWYSINQWHWVEIGAVTLSFIVVIIGFTLLRRKRRYAYRRRH